MHLVALRVSFHLRISVRISFKWSRRRLPSLCFNKSIILLEYRNRSSSEAHQDKFKMLVSSFKPRRMGAIVTLLSLSILGLAVSSTRASCLAASKFPYFQLLCFFVASNARAYVPALSNMEAEAVSAMTPRQGMKTD